MRVVKICRVVGALLSALAGMLCSSVRGSASMFALSCSAARSSVSWTYETEGDLSAYAGAWTASSDCA